MAKAPAKKEEANVPALVVTPERVPVVSGNFEQIEKYLITWKKHTLSLEMTEENLDEVRVIKKKAVMYRNSLDEILTTTKKLYFNDPKAVFEAQMRHLLSIVGEVESAADGVLAKEEQERIDGINEALDSYKNKFQLTYSLDEEHLSRIEYRKTYYNKTGKEKERKDDLEQQFKDLKREQDARAANIRLITGACHDEPRLNLQHWIDRLAHDDTAVIFEAITAEKNRLRSLDTAPAKEVQNAEVEVVETEATTQENAKIVLGIPGTIDFSTDFPGRNKTIQVEISYPCDLGDALTELFKKLKQCGIKTKVVKEKEVVF